MSAQERKIPSWTGTQEPVPLTEGRDGTASPSQHPPDSRAVPSSAEVAATEGLQGWDDHEVPGLTPAH